MPLLHPLEQLDAARFDTPAILKKLASASRKLGETVSSDLRSVTPRFSSASPVTAVTVTNRSRHRIKAMQ